MLVTSFGGSFAEGRQSSLCFALWSAGVSSDREDGDALREEVWRDTCTGK